MRDNPYVNQPCYGKHAIDLMRRINRIEDRIIQKWAMTDVVFIVDISLSMKNRYQKIKDQLRDVFEQMVAGSESIRIGLMQQGVGGSTDDPDFSHRAGILCQPTDDLGVFEQAITALPTLYKRAEWFLNAMEMAADEIGWRAGAKKLIVTIGDEQANQLLIGSKLNTSIEKFEDTIAKLKDQQVISSMICPRESSWSRCSFSFNKMARDTGGLVLIEPATADIIALIEDLSTHLRFAQTQWFKYVDSGHQIPLGIPDSGISIPPLSALDYQLLLPRYFHDMRSAIERIVSLNLITAPNSKAFNWDPGSPENLLCHAMSNAPDYGITDSYDSWKRPLSAMYTWKYYDIDIGEIHECINTLEIALEAANA